MTARVRCSLRVLVEDLVEFVLELVAVDADSAVMQHFLEDLRNLRKRLAFLFARVKRRSKPFLRGGYFSSWSVSTF